MAPLMCQMLSNALECSLSHWKDAACACTRRCVATRQVAVEYDIAVYFEANGHGTLLFSDKAVQSILDAKASAERAGDAPKIKAADRLLMTRQLINQAIGDALSDVRPETPRDPRTPP